jgi:hypothetical protein
MKTITPYALRSLIVALTLLVFNSCIPESLKETINENTQIAQNMFADQEFKKALAQIEFHKLRNGTYPLSLKDLQFQSGLDSSILNFVTYHKLDSGYELNIDYQFPSITGNETTPLKLKYPADFWKGLGCLQSNTK